MIFIYHIHVCVCLVTFVTGNTDGGKKKAGSNRKEVDMTEMKEKIA